MANEVKKQAAPAAAKAPKAPKGDAKGKTQAASKGQAPKPANYTPELQKLYKEQIIGNMMKKFQYKSIMQVPKLVKITINEGVGAATQDKKIVETAQAELSTIAGQKAVLTVSRKDISNFKLRSGMPIGCKVTLRSTKMYEFLERLICITLPRIRDFKGVEEKFDGRGNYTLGLKEQTIFPEIDIEKVTKIVGMEITFVTTAPNDEEAYALLTEFGIPFKNKKNN
jgi:large subunit ribosomal protein L5